MWGEGVGAVAAAVGRWHFALAVDLKPSAEGETPTSAWTPLPSPSWESRGRSCAQHPLPLRGGGCSGSPEKGHSPWEVQPGPLPPHHGSARLEVILREGSSASLAGRSCGISFPVEVGIGLGGGGLRASQGCPWELKAAAEGEFAYTTAVKTARCF